MKLEPTIQNEVSQKEKQQYSMVLSAKSLQSCLTLCNPIDGRPPGSPVPGVLRRNYVVILAQLTDEENEAQRDY